MKLIINLNASGTRSEVAASLRNLAHEVERATNFEILQGGTLEAGAHHAEVWAMDADDATRAGVPATFTDVVSLLQHLVCVGKLSQTVATAQAFALGNGGSIIDEVRALYEVDEVNEIYIVK